MKLTAITVRKTAIDFEICRARAGDLFEISARVPLVCGDAGAEFTPGRVVAKYTVECGDNGASIPRFSGDYDCIICAFEVYSGGGRVEGVRYVTEIDPSVPECSYPYPHVGIKALSCIPEDMDFLGISQSGLTPNQSKLMAVRPSEDTIEYIFNGRPYYFKKDVVESMDKFLLEGSKRGVINVMIYHNSSFSLGEKADDELVDIIQHPAYDFDCPTAYISAFNVRTEQGLDYFCACAEFLAERYSREDQKYGRSLSFVMGNEVTSQYVWNNAGDMTCEQFMLEYTTVMRLAWLLSCKHYANFRVHTSFDRYFNGSHIPSQPTRFYGMKASIECIAAHCRRDGDFPWNIAFHPYPENLAYPDFYNDRSPNFTFATDRITFKNVEVMPAFLAQEHLLYKGVPRRIMLTEQGFNSRDGEPFSELQGAHAYCLAYLKIRNQPTIDMFLHHAYIDNPGEFGLNLGIRRFGGYKEDGGLIPGEPKPIYYVMRDMDTPAETQRVGEARAFIGAPLFDRLLNPPPVAPDIDRSKGGLTIPGMGAKKRGKKAVPVEDRVQTNFDASV